MQADKSQNNWSEYSILPVPKTVVRRLDNKSHRFYWWQELVDDVLVIHTGIGITSLLSMVMAESKPLTDWKLRTPNYEELLSLSADYGSAMHTILQQWTVERQVSQELLDYARQFCVQAGMNKDMPEKDLFAWMAFCEEYDLKPILIEALLVSPPIDGEHYCQAVDLLCDIAYPETRTETTIDGQYKSGPRKGEDKVVETKITEKVRKIVNLDWKSNFMSKDAKSFFPTHKFQLIAAQRAVEYNYPEIKVDMLMNWAPSAWRTRPSFEMKIWNITDKDNALFDAYINIGRVSGFFKPSGSIFIPPPFLPETKSSDFKMLSYEQYVSDVILAPDVAEAAQISQGSSPV